MIKKIILSFSFVVYSLFSFSQCVPNPIYQDSMPNVWPSSGFPDGMVGVSYSQSWDMKTPATLLDAALGDSSIVTVDTLGSTIYIGDWLVDSVVTIDVYDIPPGLIVECSAPGCSYPGNQVGCADISGIPTTIGTYSTDIVTNLYSHGVVTITVGGVPLTVPVELDYFSVTGAYDTIHRYTITIVEATSIIEQKNNLEITNIINQNNNLYFNIYSSNSDIYNVIITDMLGRSIYTSDLLVNSGKNTHNIAKYIENGIYIITIKNNTHSFSEKIKITSSN
jgi:hypothetical protein